MTSDRYHFDPDHLYPGRCVRCGNELDDDKDRCETCGLSPPEALASRAWVRAGKGGSGVLGAFGGDLRGLLGDER